MHSGIQYTTKGLRERRAKIRTEIEAIGTAMRNEKRAMTTDERERFYRLNTEVTELGNQIRSAELEMNAPEFTPGRGDVSHEPSRRAGGRQSDGDLALRGWLNAQNGFSVTDQQRRACTRLGIDPRSQILNVARGTMAKRAMTVTTTGGGYLIAEDFSRELDQVLVQASGIREHVRVIQTENGADLPWPTSDDTSNTGELLAINTAAAEADPTLASVTFQAFKYSSKLVLVPAELMQDAAFDMEQYVAEIVATRIGDVQGTDFTTGDGSGKPKGIVTCASAGITTASATAFTADELQRLVLSVNPVYRSAANNPMFMMKEDTLGYCMLLKDASGRPLLRDSMKDGFTVPMIHGYPVAVNQKITGLTSNLPVTATKHVIFGAMKKFIVRDAGPLRFKRLDERYAEKDQVGFIAFLRSDSDTTNSAAIKYMLQA